MPLTQKSNARWHAVFSRKTLKYVIVTLAVLCVLYAALGFFLAPWAIRHYAPGALQSLLGRAVVLGEVHVNPFLLTADIAGIRIGDDKAPLATADRLHVDASSAGALRRTWTLDDLTLEGLKLNVLRRQDGTLDVAEIFQRFAKGGDSKTEPVRAMLHRLSIPQASIRFTDLSGNEPAAASIDAIDFTASNLSTLNDQKAAYQLKANLPLDGRLDLNGKLVLQPSLQANGEMSLKALNAAWLWPFVRDRVALSDIKGNVDVSTRYAYDAAKSLRLDAANLTASDLLVARAGQPPTLLAMKRIGMADGQLLLAEKKFTLGTLRIEEGQANAEIDSAGRLDWAGIAKPSAQNKPAPDLQPKPTAMPLQTAWNVAVGKLQVAQVGVLFTDRRTPQAVSFEVADIAFDLGLSLTSGDALQLVADGIGVTLKGLQLKSDGAPKPLATLDSVTLQQGRLNLVERQFTAVSLKAEGGQTSVVRQANGAIELLELLGVGADNKSALKQPAPVTTAGNSSHWNYGVDAVRLGDVLVNLVDRGFQPAVAYGLTLQSASAQNITNKTGVAIPFEAAVAVAQGGMLRVTGSVAPDGRSGQAALNVDKLALGPLQPVILRYAGMSLQSGPLSSSGQVKFALPSKGAPTVQVDGLALSLPDVLLSRQAGGPRLLSLKQFELAGGSLDLAERRVELRRVKLSRGDVAAAIARDGRVDWQPSAPQVTVSPATKTLANVGGAPWRVNVDTLALEQIGARFLDRSRSTPVALDIARMDAQLKLGVEVGGGPLQIVVNDLGAQFKTIGLTSLDTPSAKLLALGTVAIEKGNLDLQQKRAGAATLKLQDGQGRIVRDAQGRMELAQMLANVNPQPAGQGAKLAPTSDAPAWQYALDNTQIDRFNVQYLDKSMRPAWSIDAKLAANIQTLSSQSPASFKAQVALAKGGTIDLQGKADLAKGSVQAKVDAEGLSLLPLEAMVRQRAAVDLRSGTAKASLTVDYQQQQQNALRAKGTLQVNDLLLVEASSGDRLFSWKQLNADGFDFDLGARSLRMGEINLSEPGAKLEIEKDRTVNIKKILAAGNGPDKKEPGKEPAQTQAQAQAQDDSPPFTMEIGKIRFSNGTVDYADQSLVLPFATQVTRFDGTIVDISSDKTHRAGVSAKGDIQQYGSASVEGRIVPFDPAVFTDLRVRFNNVRVKPLSPYTATFAGRTVESGKLWLDLAYKIEDGNLNGKNDVRLADFVLGDRVEAPGAVDLPLNLAVALLTDSDGEIKLSVPVLGDLDNPRFSFGGAVRAAIGNALQRVVTAPFRLLGRLFGVSGETLASIDFAPGSQTLRPEQQEKLDKLTKALGERPKLRLVVSAPYDSQVDGQALRRAQARVAVAQLNGQTVRPGEDLGPVAYEDRTTQASLQGLLEQQAGSGAAESLRASLVSGQASGELYRRMFEAIVEGFPVSNGAVQQLAAGRALGIAGYLQRQGLEDARVQTGRIAEVPVAKDGSVPARLELSGG